MDIQKSEHGDMVPAEHALEHMSTDQAWHLLASLSSRVESKQTELQLMVGSRYHELIESADSIVTMKKTSLEVLELLKEFPQTCSSVILQVPSMSAPRSSGDGIQEADKEKDPPSARLLEVIQLMLHAPAEMWAALDSKRVLDAANLLLACRRSWDQVSRSHVGHVDPGLAAFLRSHVTYVEQFPDRIVLAATNVLTHSDEKDETARALAALLLLKAQEEEEPLRCLLEVLLRRRGAIIVGMLKKAARECSDEDIQQVMVTAIRTVRKTIIDVHTIFAPGLNEDCFLLKVAGPTRVPQASHGLAEHQVKSLCTRWLAILAPKIRSWSKKLLGAVSDTSSMAQIRGALWALTHAEGTSAMPSFSSAEASMVTPVVGAADTLWIEAAAFAINAAALMDGGATKGGGAVSGVVSPSGAVDLWGLLLSTIFAELAEVLLRDSFQCIRADFEARIASVLAAITGWKSGSATESGRDGRFDEGTKRSTALMAHDVMGAAESVVRAVMVELVGLFEDTGNLTERGDQHAAKALERSFYLLCVQMACSMSHRLRVALDQIGSRIQSLKDGVHERGLSQDLDDIIGKLVDASLVMGRIAWMLKGQAGRPLQVALSRPRLLGGELGGRIERHQLEAAFIIADTDGDGIVDAQEAAEALEAVSFGASAELVLDPRVYTSFTLEEFFLFATSLLEEQEPIVHLFQCLDQILGSSLEMWADCSLSSPEVLLSESCMVLAKYCQSPGMTDKAWQEAAHGVWEEKAIELDADGDGDGDGDDDDDDDDDGGHRVEETLCVPTTVSPPLLCYIEGVAAELSRILSITDLMEACRSTSDGMVYGGQSRSLLNDTGAAHGKRSDVKGEVRAAGYARSLTAARAAKVLDMALGGLCTGPEAPAARSCEAAQIQLLLDALFVQRAVRDVDNAAASVDSIVLALCDLIDPVNLQIYMPHLQAAVAGCWATCHTSLSLIFEAKSVHDSRSMVAAAGALTGAAGGSSNLMALAPKVRRFEILPLPLSTLANGKARARISLSHKPEGQAEHEGGDSWSESKGMQAAGRQALAGLMDQVGNVGSVLSAQNVNVQSVFGAASLFLGGRNRRTDEAEERVL